MKPARMVMSTGLLVLVSVQIWAAEGKPAFINTLGMKFVFIPAGSFTMGSPPSERGRDDDERQHLVTITRGFFMSTTEVTQGQWQQLMTTNPSGYKNLGTDGPVDQVSWNDCREFADKLNQQEGTSAYRLPTEAEWEYACRAGSGTAFANGEISEIGCIEGLKLGEMAWFCGNSGYKPHVVATKNPNAWGLYDMHGNVHEWVADSCEWRDLWTRRALVITNTYRDNAVDPLSTEGELRIFRGGSWNQSPKYSRSADRSCFRPKTRRTDIGFRLVKTE